MNHSHDRLTLCALLILILTSAHSVLAEDAGTVAASLPNEKAECRYLRRLADEVLAGFKAIEAAKATYRQAESSGSSTAAQIARKDAMEEWNIAIAGTEKKLVSLDAATRVVEAKHDKPPKCVQTIKDEMNANSKN